MTFIGTILFGTANRFIHRKPIDMKRLYLIFFLLMPVAPGVYSQQLTSFVLPIDREGETYSSAAYVSAKYTIAGRVPIKNYQGNDAGIKKLSELIGYVRDDKQKAYKDISATTDTTLDQSFGFYKVFLPRSQAPVLYGTAYVGNYSFYYVELDEGIPLMAFALENIDGTYFNHPDMINVPAATALTSAINMSYLMPQEFQSTTAVLNKNMVITIDSVFGDRRNPLLFSIDTAHVYYNVPDKADTANVYNAKYQAVLGHYKNALEVIGNDDLDGFYAFFSEESSTRIRQHLSITKS